MSKVLLFFLLTWLTGSPIVAIIVLLIVFYALERRFIGLTPSVTKPIRQSRRLSKLRQELRLSPHQTSAKLDAARILMEKKRYREAAELLEQVFAVMEDSAEVRAELGICRLKLGELQEGERLILEAFEMNPRVKYGEPYLRLAEAWADREPAKAIHYLETFGSVNSSSCEAYYRLGRLYGRLGDKEKARGAYRETVELYRGLPKYRRRFERRWALLARYYSMTNG
ncbi:tetratricopeptide repeat protein [Paenibacillus doosanensis]|uniref:Tetratricopeptide repeat protein n=1 Tax=Paenibacillus konkukensis TaxID=2020716 RepID=A0ABY4RMN1_9BACL|nr:MULTISPECIES: tetratricopeptide repeat protein [Paenibacillus]MCS7462213.1 tetratricopeptide repeat protein [Paenibacillus doosanensis]UQZ82924.1 Tetratricopeptide repeat protein [Paenibacillus konkukensis]